ncbi:MAG: Mov34/MPN/PAD-1 family protein [Candidatus Methylomirabilales bacterium]
MFPIYRKEPGFSEPEEPIYYLVTRDGLFQVKRTPLFRSRIRVRGLSWLQGEAEGVELLLPVIPAKILGETMAFFREVFRKYRAEAAVLLYLRAGAGEYEIRIPPQKVAGGHCRYEIGPNPPGCLRVGTIHSHGAAEAFHSELDDVDEQYDDGLHVTIGSLHAKPTVSCSLVVDGRRFDLRPDSVLEVMPWELEPTLRLEDSEEVTAEPSPGDADPSGRPSAI